MKDQGIAKALREAAAEAKWSATQIAYTTGTGEGTARKWLAGNAIPRADRYQKLLDTLPGFQERIRLQNGARRA